MEFLNFVSGDNLFKYCFTLGVVIVVFSLIYPLQKKNDIEIEIISHNKEIQLLNNEIGVLDKLVKKLEKNSLELLGKANSKKNKRNRQNIELAKKFNSEYDSAARLTQSLVTKNIVLDFNKTKIKTLQSQADVFNSFAFWLKWIGIILSLFGMVFWTISTFKEWNNRTR